MKIIECEQRSSEWYEARRGIPTSSNFDKIITLDEKPSKQSKKYMYKLAGETITKTTEDEYANGDIERGRILENEAIKLYEFTTKRKVQRIGFCIKSIKGGNVGYSPDGFVNDNGIIEVKCPKMATHVLYLKEDVMPLDYFQQTQGGLFVSGRKWVDFISYYPGMKLFIKRASYNERFNIELEKELSGFCIELKNLVKQLR